MLLRTVERAVTLDPGTLSHALAKVPLKPKEPFTLEGYLDAPTQDLYQFQLRLKGKASLQVDGVPHPVAGDEAWTFVPVHLTPGTHHLKATFEPSGNPTDLDLRFGSRGAQTIRIEQFRCPSP